MSMFAGSLQVICPWCKKEDIEIHRIDFPSIASGGNTVGWHCVHNCESEIDIFNQETTCPWCEKPESIYSIITRGGVLGEFEITVLGWHAIHFCHDHNRIKGKNSSFANKKIVEMYDEANREEKEKI